MFPSYSEFIPKAGVAIRRETFATTRSHDIMAGSPSPSSTNLAPLDFLELHGDPIYSASLAALPHRAQQDNDKPTHSRKVGKQSGQRRAGSFREVGDGILHGVTEDLPLGRQIAQHLHTVRLASLVCLASIVIPGEDELEDGYQLLRAQ